MSKLVVVVPRDRARCGRAVLVGADGKVRLGPFRVLATANRRMARRHGNPDRDRLRPFGHAPAGTFLLAGSLPPGVAPNPRRARRFGRLGALVLTPERGEALAALANGRRHVYLHGGPLDRRGRLRPTLGGLRVADEDLGRVFRAVNDAFSRGDPLRSVEVVEIDPALGPAGSPGDRVGRGKPAPARPQHARAAPSQTSGLSLKHAALLVGGIGLLELRRGEPAPEDPSRRKAMALGLLVLGSLGAAGCEGPDEPAPSACVICDPYDPACPPGGYLCPGDDPRIGADPGPGPGPGGGGGAGGAGSGSSGAGGGGGSSGTGDAGGVPDAGDDGDAGDGDSGGAG